MSYRGDLRVALSRFWGCQTYSRHCAVSTVAPVRHGARASSSLQPTDGNGLFRRMILHRRDLLEKSPLMYQS